jgi:hypothetical protein
MHQKMLKKLSANEMKISLLGSNSDWFSTNSTYVVNGATSSISSVSGIITILSALSFMTYSLCTPIKHFLARPTEFFQLIK